MEKENHTVSHVAAPGSAMCPADVSMMSARGPPNANVIMACDDISVDLVNIDQVNADVMMTSAFGGPRADVMLTSAGHVALPSAATCQPVCFSFSENLLFNSKNCFKLQKLIINQPELRKL